MIYASIISAVVSLLALYFFVNWQRALRKSVESETRLEGLRTMLSDVELVRDQVMEQKEGEHMARTQAETQIEVLKQDIKHVRQQLEDKNKVLEESMKTAELVMLKKGREVFKEEAQNFSKHTMEKFESVVKSVASLHDRVHKNEGIVDTVWRSLTTPGAAGQFSELGLENTFKQYGLEAGRDFIMQYHIKDSSQTGKRPDALVLLPGDNILVVDSKASKFFLELADAEGTPQEKQIMDKLLQRMQQHVKELAGKGYRDAVIDMYKHTDKPQKAGHILTAMFIHSEAYVEKLCTLDPDFRNRCAKENIILTGPVGLSGLLSISRYSIAIERQERNNEEILSELGGLLGSVETVLKHAGAVGKGIMSAAQHYEKMTGSVNKNFLPKARRIAAHGVQLPKSKQLPDNLPSYHVITENSPTIEGEVEHIEDKVKKLEDVG